jgi:hypothetical protein
MEMESLTEMVDLKANTVTYREAQPRPAPGEQLR